MLIFVGITVLLGSLYTKNSYKGVEIIVFQFCVEHGLHNLKGNKYYIESTFL
jgi:hypothetical protein